MAWARKAYARTAAPDLAIDNETFALRALLLLGMVAFVVACTGVGGFTFRFPDYWLYDGMLRMLMEYSWPPGMIADLPDPGTHASLPYYFAYYLPSALVGKLFGWWASQFFAYLWNTFGTLLAVIWFMRLVGTFRLRYALLFLFFSGLDLVGYIFTAPLPDGHGVTWLDYATGTFWWSIGRGWMAHWSANYSLLTPEGQSLMGGVFYRFYGMMSFLFDGPCHVLPAWVLLLIVLHDAIRRKTVERLFFLTSILPLCSIFVTMGTVPVLLLSLWETRGKRLFTLGNMFVGPLVALTLLLWYRGVEAETLHGWVWTFLDLNRTWWYLLLYYFCGFGLYALVAPSMRGNACRPGRPWFFTTVAVFLFAPWYRFGIYNDFTTKVVIPCQLVFLVCLATALRDPEGKNARWRQRLLAVALFVGAWSGLGIIGRAVEFGFSSAPPPLERVACIADGLARAFKDGPLERVKFHGDTFFWKYLARPVEYVHSPENKPVLVCDFRDSSKDADIWRYCDHEHRVTPGGVVIDTPGNTALLMSESMDLDTRAIGSIEIDCSVVDGQGRTPEYEMAFQWANADQVRAAQSNWPFHKWCYSVLVPHGLPLSSNSYWKGQVSSVSLYFKVKNPSQEHYTVTLHSLTFLQR